MKSTKDHSYLNDAAVLMQKSFRSPILLLEFLTESISWVINWQRKDKEKSTTGSYFFSKLLITEIAIPWLKATGNPTDIIARGLNEALEYYGIEEFGQCAGIVMAALGHDISETGIYIDNAGQAYQKGVGVLLDISRLLYQHVGQQNSVQAA